MKERNLKERPEIKWEVMDVTQMDQIEANTFDLVVDKSTIDALLCGDNSFVNVAKMCKEVQRVLKVGGAYFVISYGKPESRAFHFEQDFLSFNIREFIVYDQEAITAKEKEEKTHYIYVCTKKEDADEISELNYTSVLEVLEKDEEAQKEYEKE